MTHTHHVVRRCHNLRRNMPSFACKERRYLPCKKRVLKKKKLLRSPQSPNRAAMQSIEERKNNTEVEEEGVEGKTYVWP